MLCRTLETKRVAVLFIDHGELERPIREYREYELTLKSKIPVYQLQMVDVRNDTTVLLQKYAKAAPPNATVLHSKFYRATSVAHEDSQDSDADGSQIPALPPASTLTQSDVEGFQAEDYIQASQQQPIQYSSPHIIFAFYNSVSCPMAEKLKEMGISVRGDIIAVNTSEEGVQEKHFCDSESDDDESGLLHVGKVDRENVVASVAFPTEIRVQVCNRVNLDITTLITYVSALSHGGCHLVFKEKVLTEQAAQERQEKMLPILDSFMEGKELFACESAVKDFQAILETLGRPNERERAETLIKKITVVADQPSERALKLAISSKINRRSVSIFGTGDNLKAITMTANSGFVRAANNQGVKFSVFIHQPRALTESKEASATPIPKNHADVS
ncbi:UPF0415 protein C7orf25 homolog [Gastrophryne carolinensis]